MTVTVRNPAGAAVSRGGPVALATLCTLLFLTFLDNTVVSVALGSVQSDLHAGVQALQWVVGAYDAFQAGLHAALYLSAGLLVAAGILAVVTLGRSPARRAGVRCA